MKTTSYITLIFFAIFMSSCITDDPIQMEAEEEMEEEMEEEAQTQFGAFDVQEDLSVTLTGVITSSTATDLEDLLVLYPNTAQIIVGDLNSASSHEAAFAAARIVRNNDLDIHISDNSTVRKEATNFLLGGIKRTKGENVQIGVSAWMDDLGLEATDYDFGHEAHLPWINFFVEMGYQFQLAADFYNFYIYTAGADDIYFMSDDQLNTYDIIN